MEQYVFLSPHLEKESATAVMWGIFSMDHHGEHVKLMVTGVDSNLPVKVSTASKWNHIRDLVIKDTLGPANLSTVERLSTHQR